MKLPIQLIILAMLYSSFSYDAIAQSNNWDVKFKELDKNQNGQLDSTELKRKRLFARLDTNQDGVITLDEAKRILSANEIDNSVEISVKKDVAYGKHKQQKLDVYRNTKKSVQPVMIYVHGGGWQAGDKSRVGEKAKFFTQQNWTFVSINYRLFPAGKHPKNVEDVAAAISHVSKNAASYGVDKDAIYLMGHSAGCHLVSLVATDERKLNAHELSLTTIKGVIALDTQAYDVVERVANTNSDTYAKIFGTVVSRQKDASPQFHVAKDKSIPPFFIAYSRGLGDRTNAERPKAANAFATQLRNSGTRAEVADGSDRNHSEINQRFGKSTDVKITQAAWKFLNSIQNQKNESPKQTPPKK